MEVKDPPYRKKVYDLLSQNFSDFKRTEEEFNAKLDSDPAYAEQVYGVLSQNFADFKRPKDEFLGMLGKPQAPTPQAPQVGGGGALPTGPAISSAPQQPPSAMGSGVVQTTQRDRFTQGTDELGDALLMSPVRQGLIRPKAQGDLLIGQVESLASKPRVFSVAPQSQGNEALPQLDPRWVALQDNYRASGGLPMPEGATPLQQSKWMSSVVAKGVDELNRRRDVLSAAAEEEGRRGLAMDEQKLNELSLDLSAIQQQYPQGVPQELFPEVQAKQQQAIALHDKIQSRKAMYAAEQDELNAMASFLSRKLGQAEIRRWQDPDVQNRLAQQLVADDKWNQSQMLMQSGVGINDPRVLREQVLRPVSQAVLNAGGNIGATITRLAASSQPQGGNTQQILDDAAGWFSEGLRDLDSRKPSALKKSLLGDDWSLNEGWLPKLVEAGTYMGFLAAGGTAGAAGMVGTGILSSSDNYYREAVDAGMNPDEAEAFSLLMSGTESAVELVNPGPFFNANVRSSLAKQAIKSIKAGEPASKATKAAIASYMAKQGAVEGLEENITSLAQNAVKNGANAVTGADLDTEFTLKGEAENFILGAALGGLMGGAGKLSQRPVYKEGVKWAIENESAFMEYLRATVPEAQQAPIIEKYEKYKSIYRGLPPTLPKDKTSTIAAAVAEKERIKEEQAKTTIDETVAAAIGNQFDERIKEQDDIIAAELGIDLVELAKVQEAKRLQEQYDKQKLKSEITGTPMPEGSARPEVPALKTSVVEAPTESPVRLEVTPQPTIEQQPTEVEDESRGNSLAENTSESGDMGLGNEGRATGAEAPADQSEATGVPPEAGAVEPPRSTTITQLTEEVPDNPEDLANAYLSDHYDYNGGGNKDAVLAQLTKARVGRDSYLRFGDRNNIAQGFAKFYLRKKGQGIDQIAEEATDMLGYEVTPDDVVEYMHNNPDGRRMQSPRMVELDARYGELTGKKLNTLVARAILKNSKNNPIAVASALTGIDEDALQISEEESELWANMSDDEKRSIWEEREQAIAELEAADQAAGEGGDVVLGSEEAIQPLSAKSLQEAFGYTPEVAQATEAIADAMGLDKSKIKVVRGGRAGENALFQEQVDGWYSRLDQAVSSKGSTMPASQWKTWMESRAKDGMMSMEEAKWTGLSDFLASKGNEKVTPQQVREFLNENRVRVEVVVLDDGGDTKYHDPLTPEEDERRQLLQNEFAEWTNENGGGYVGARPLTREERQELDGYMQRHRASIARQDEGRARATKFSQYQLPGGTNYREVLVTLPKRGTAQVRAELVPGSTRANGKSDFKVFDEAGNWTIQEDALSPDDAIRTAQRFQKADNSGTFRSSHFDEPNILVHLRLNDRTDADGKKVLFIEELQSDWGQKGKKKGFGGKELTAERRRQLQDEIASINATRVNGMLPVNGREETAQRLSELRRELDSEKNTIPSAPFVTSTDAWVELGLKQAIRMAVDGGYDKIAWTTGEQQFNRWGSQAFAWSKGKTGWRIIGKEQSGGEAFAGMEEALAQEAKESDTIITSKEELREVVEDVMGRERSDYSPENWKTHINKMVDGMWERMQNEDSGTTMPRREGMKGFYDKILPTVAKKVAKKLGGDGMVGETEFVKGELRWVVTPPDSNIPYWQSASKTEAEAHAKKTNGVVRRPSADMTQQSIAITPEMRQRVSMGVPLMQGEKGAVEFGKNGEAIIRALKNPDASTGVHELAHVARRFLFDKSIPQENRKGITDEHIDTAEKWAGAKDGNWTREAEEKFARGFERYLRDGNAPNEALRDVFAKFAQWLQSIYKKLKGSTVDIEVSAEMRKVFDSLISRGQSSDFRRKDAKPVTEITELSKRTDPKGKPLEVEYSVPGFEEYPTVAYREAGGWEVAIRGTGANVPTGGAHPTPRLAISSAAEAMRRAGKEKLDKAISKAMDQQSSLADRIEKAADELEKKLRGMAGSFPVPPTVLVSAMRAAAKAVRAGESFAKAVKAAIEDMRASKWWKTLSPADQRSAEREVREQLRVALEPKEPKPAVKKTDVKKVVDRETGVRPEKKEVTVDVRKALKDQIRLEARAAREAKADVRTKQKDFAARIREALKNELYGRLKPRQAEVIIGRAAATNPDNPRAVQRFFDYASKVIADANYAEDLGVAKDLVRKARKLSRNKGIPVNLAEILQGIAMVDVSMVDDLPTFASMVGGFLRSFDRVANGKYEMGDVRAMRKYLRGVEAQVQKAKDQMLKDELDELEEYLSTLDEDKVSMVREYLTTLAIGSKEDLAMVDTSSMSKEDKAVIDAMKTVDLSMLSDAQLADYVFFADNITVNESLDGIGQAAAMVMGVNMAKETADITGTAGIRTTWPTMNMRGLDMREAVRTLYYGMPNAFARIAGFAHALGDITEAMGDTNIRMGRSSADASLNKEANALNDFLKQQAQKGKKAGREPESTRNKLMEGIVGFVMQRVPRYDAQESFEINRDLIAQDIKNVKEGEEKLGKKKGLSREYETIEELYNTYLKDAASLEDVMKAFKRDMPENAAVVQYLIDMQGRYADEVLSHNRRFRNQADEKQPNYLPKTYIKSEYASKDQGAIIDGDVKKTGYEKIAEKLVKPYQSGTLKQRTSSRKLRAGTRIDYNLRRNSVQALGENLYDARTSQYWMAIREMFRTEGIANALGGERNARFMQKKAAELYEAQVRKGIKPILNEDIEKWLDRASDDVKRYASFLGLAGFWQFAQQASDQLVNTVIMSSRNKKMARRMFQSMGDVYLRNSNGLSDLLELGSIGERARLMAGTRWDTELESQMRRVEKAIGSGNLKAIQDAQEFMADKMFVALRTSDVFNATTQWVQYYKDYLDSKGEKVDDWAEEAKKVMEGDKVRRRAFAYAENKTDLTQGPSDPTRFAPIGRKSSNVIANVVRTAFTAFIAFPSSQYARIMQAASEVVSDLPAERKKEAFRILTSTAASIATFHGTRHILRPLAIYGMAQVIKGAAEGLLGDDDDEKALAVLALVSEAAFLAKMNDRDFNKAIEEAYKQERKERLLVGEYDAAVELRKRLTDNMKMWYTSAITDLTAGGLPEGVGKFEADMMNRVGYSIAVMSKDPSVMTKAGSLIPFDEWSKDPSNTPFPYYGQWSKEADWGMFSMVPDRVNIFMDKFDALYRDKMEEGGAAYEEEIRPEFRTRFYDRADKLKEFLLTKDEKGLKEYVKTLDPKQRAGALKAFYKAKAMPNADPWYHVVAGEPDPLARALAYWSVYSEASPEERKKMDDIANRLRIRRSETARYLKELEAGTYRGSPEK